MKLCKLANVTKQIHTIHVDFGDPTCEEEGEDEEGDEEEEDGEKSK
jgi:hypothetical protein